MTRIENLIAEVTNMAGDRAVSYNSTSAAWEIRGVRLWLGYSGRSRGWRSHTVRRSLRKYDEQPGIPYESGHALFYGAAVHTQSYTSADARPLRRMSACEFRASLMPCKNATCSYCRSRKRNCPVQTCRTRGTRLLIAIEYKYYAGHLSLQLARGFHGLHADLGVKIPTSSPT